MRFESPERYQIRATHPLFNRRLWALDVTGSQARLVDYLQKRTCSYQGRAEIEAVPLGPFPFAGLPALLLGYLPMQPSGEVAVGEERLAYTDREDRVWVADLEKGLVSSWRSSRDGQELATWSRGEDWVEMTAVKEGIRLRWRETLREEGLTPLQAISAPVDADEGACDLGWLRGVEDVPWEGGV